VAAVATLVLLAGCSGSDDGADDAAPTSTTAGSAAPTTEATTTTGPPPELPADRPIEVIVPEGLDPDAPAPLVVLLHGFGANGEGQAAYLRLLPAAAERGMLVVAPDGTENENGRRFWNATDACCGGPGAEVDDVAYLDAVIANVRADHAVDPDRIFVMGHSNGGFMSFRMACEHAEVVAAIASIAGATFADPEACDPTEPVSVLAIHGIADDTIAYEGDDIAGRTYPSAAETVATWAGYDGCEATPVDAPDPAERAIVRDLPPASVTQYDGCDAGTSVELWSQPEGVHIPAWGDGFIEQVLDWLEAHPKG
jgi:polyhydroxybutyrate depolymerase